MKKIWWIIIIIGISIKDNCQYLSVDFFLMKQSRKRTGKVFFSILNFRKVFFCLVSVDIFFNTCCLLVWINRLDSKSIIYPFSVFLLKSNLNLFFRMKFDHFRLIILFSFWSSINETIKVIEPIFKSSLKWVLILAQICF